MTIHNILEEQVISRVNELFEQVKSAKPSWFTCDCELCRMDAMCYVLNRMRPRYVLSGRGLTFHNAEDGLQLNADIDALAMEGIRLVSGAKRPYHDSYANKKVDVDDIHPSYNFPTFVGTVYDGSMFESLADVQISLMQQGKLVTMMDVTWSNPCKTVASTAGNYSFWVKPVDADEAGKSSVFSFTLKFEANGYDSISYSFDVPVISENRIRTEPNSVNAVKIKDMYLFPLEA